MKNQAGFRTGRSCIQQIHSIDRDMMFAILQHIGIPDKIVSTIRILYDQSTSQVYIKGQQS